MQREVIHVGKLVNMVGDINMKHVGKFMGDVEIIENCREMSWC